MTDKKNPNEVFFPFAFAYKLTKVGLRESLLQGGNGKEEQRVEGQISLADADALGIGLDGLGGLTHRTLDMRSSEFRYGGSTRTYDNTDLGDFMYAYYDEPQEFAELLTDAIRHRDERKAIFAQFKAEREEARQAVLRGEVEYSLSSGRVYFDYAGKTYKLASDPDLDAMRTAHRLQAEEAEAKAKAERETEEAARKQVKLEQIAAWVAEQGSANQRERFAAGLFPEDEAVKAIEESAFTPLAELALYERIAHSEVRATCSERCRCSDAYDDETTCEITCNTETVEHVTAEEWEQMKRITNLLPDATVALKSHHCTCDDRDCVMLEGEGVIDRKGFYVKLQVGGFTFNREYAVQ